jgi:hypothetical protein
MEMLERATATMELKSAMISSAGTTSTPIGSSSSSSDGGSRGGVEAVGDASSALILL